MPHQMTLNPLILVKFVLWIVVVIVATALLRRRQVTSKARVAFLAEWKPPFWLANSVRTVAFVVLVVGLVAAGLDWIGVIDPFQLFSFNFTLWIGVFSAGVIVASLFLYRPWCRFLCPFGLVGWLVEQVSLLRPRINREVCKECQVCAKACPSQAMADFYDGKKLHADCFACGACIEACPQEKALGWWTSSQAK